MHARALVLSSLALSSLASIFVVGCGGSILASPIERPPGVTHAGLYDEWIAAESGARRPATVLATTSEEDAPKPAAEPSTAVLPEPRPAPAPERAETREPAPREPAPREPAPREPRDTGRGMVSDVGEVYPLRPEGAEETVAVEPPVCPVEPTVVIDPEVLREMDERARYRHPEGTATRVAGGPPDDFERPPGTASVYGHAWPGGFDRAPGTADDLPAPRDTSE